MAREGGEESLVAGSDEGLERETGRDAVPVTNGAWEDAECGLRDDRPCSSRPIRVVEDQGTTVTLSSTRRSSEHSSGGLSRHLSWRSSRLSSRFSALSSLLDFSDLAERENADQARGVANAMELLRNASMIVQMENEGFMEEHAEDMLSDEVVSREAKDEDDAKYLPGKDAYAGLWPRFEKQFWLDSGILILLGGILGLACIGYQYAITSAPRAYLTVDNPGYPRASVGFFQGQYWWIGIGAGTGLVVGVMRELLQLRAYLGFVALIQLQDAGVAQSVKVILCSIVSLAGSASVGPEAGFSAIGGGAAALLYKYILRWDRRKADTSFNPTVLEIPGVTTFSPPNYYFAVGIIYGVMGALLALYYVICQLVVKAAFDPVKKVMRTVFGERVGRVVVAVIGGALYGVIGWALPLTMGDGSFQLIAPVTYAGSMDTGVLAASCFFNILSFWISVESGFVGGVFTPLIYSGSLLGAVFSNISEINTQVARSCGFVALAAALIPAPITLCFFAASIFRLGAPYLFPLLTCCFTSHILFDGTGAALHLTRVLRERRLRGKQKRKPQGKTIKFVG